MRNPCGISSPAPASSRAASPLVRRLKQRSMLASGPPPLGNELAEDLLSSELRNIHAELFGNAAHRSRVRSDAHWENRSSFSPGGYCSGHSHLLFQKRSVHCDPITCRRLILSPARFG